MTIEANKFADATIKAVIRALSVYPLNDFVVLNTGELGLVVDTNPDNPLRPSVRLLYSAKGNELDSPKVVDLAQHSQLWITSALTADQLPQRMQ